VRAGAPMSVWPSEILHKPMGNAIRSIRAYSARQPDRGTFDKTNSSLVRRLGMAVHSIARSVIRIDPQPIVMEKDVLDGMSLF
jgi:hypothetical protein